MFDRRLTDALSVSVIGFGCGTTAALMVEGSAKEREAAVGRALDLGITYFDTAPRYGNGLSETNLGATLKALGASPVVGTKVAFSAESVQDIKRSMTESVEESLSRLQRDSLDLLQLHNHIRHVRDTTGFAPGLSTEDILGPGGVAETFEELRRAGKVRHLGFTARGDVGAILEVIRSVRFHTMQTVYNLLNPSAAYSIFRGTVDEDFGGIVLDAMRAGMGVLAIRVLAAGALAGQAERLPGDPGGPSGVPRSEYIRSLEIARSFDAIAESQGSTRTALAIRTAIATEGISTVVIGFSNVDQLEQAVACADGPELSPETMTVIQQAKGLF